MERGSRLGREIWGVLICVLGILLILSLYSYDPRDRSLNTPSGNLDTSNWGGVIGAYLADSLLQGLGLSAYLLPILLFIVSTHLFRGPAKGLRLEKVAGFALVLWSGAILLSLLSQSETARETGGILGGFSKEILISLFGNGGATLIVLALLLLAVMLVSQISIVSLLQGIARKSTALLRRARQSVQELHKSLHRRREKRRAENKRKDRQEFKAPPIVLKEEVKEEPPKRAKKKPPLAQEQIELPEVGQGYTLPSLAYLDSPDGGQVKIDKETLEANSLILQKKLADFGVEGEVVAVRPGPVITMYEFKPAPGVKLRRIVTLADDLSMALRAVSVRILAPIPGESVVGIEIPNPKRERVFLKQILESDSYQSAESKLTLALGKDISGSPFVTDLARMPHLLVAGATGTGKSVAINVMVLSILYKASPQDVQFIMIDPKMLELTVYEGLPHLLVPVVIDPKKATAALFWAMDEMDRRYSAMREKGARNIDHYNLLLAKETVKDRIIELEQMEESGKENPNIGGDLPEKTHIVHERLPRIAIVVDELADLIIAGGRDVEDYITRLAQKARAAGIHLILATQRPSVDVLTGLIKANFPARISFQVTSRVDSRTIIDSMGAERLLGDGDMLFLPPGTARLTRIHGAYVSDREIRKVVEFIKQQGKPRYRQEVFESRKEIEAMDGDHAYDEMYDLAVELVSETQQASISMIQRRLRVGYNRAARMIEQMERDGVVGPAEGARPREVYARKIEQ
ncbi:MAG: DNA translocase FtsK [Candidatus Binatia bacterium]